MITQNMFDRIVLDTAGVLHGTTAEARDLWQDFLKAHPADISHFFSYLDRTCVQAFFKKMPGNKRLAVFLELSEPLRALCLAAIEPAEREEILTHLPVDELTDFLDELSDEELKKYLKLLQRKEREQVISLLKFEPDSAGGLMHTQVFSLNAELTVERAVHILQRIQPDQGLHQRIFVTDSKHRLVGHIQLEDLVLRSGKSRLASIMKENEVVVTAEQDGEDVARLMKHYSLMIVPVVSSENTFLGVISTETLVEILEDEASEDIYRMAAVGPIEYTYFETPFVRLLGQRLAILIVLLFVQSLSTAIITFYQATLEGFLVLFITMLTSTGGNASNQTSALAIQGLSSGEITAANTRKFLRRESLMALVMGLTLGLFSFIRIYPFYGAEHLVGCMVVSISLGLIVLFSVLLGGAMPFILKKIGLDPAHSAGPLLATVIDVAGLLIYCLVSSSVLGGAGA